MKNSCRRSELVVNERSSVVNYRSGSCFNNGSNCVAAVMRSISSSKEVNIGGLVK